MEPPARRASTVRAWKPPSRASARCSTPASRSTPTRSTPTTPGRCSSSTRARSATTSAGTARGADRRWCRSFRRTSSTTVDRPAPTGYRKRVIYLETERPRRDADRAGGRSAGDRATRRSARRSSASTTPSAASTMRLEAETRFAIVAERSAGRPRCGAVRRAEARAADLAEALRAYLDAHLFEPITLAAAADDARRRRDPSRSRVLETAFGIAPHAYVDRPPAGRRPRPHPRRPAVGGRRDRGRLRRSGPPDPAVQAVPGDDPGCLRASSHQESHGLRLARGRHRGDAGRVESRSVRPSGSDARPAHVARHAMSTTAEPQMRGYPRNRLTDRSDAAPVVTRTTLSRGYAISYDDAGAAPSSCSSRARRCRPPTGETPVTSTRSSAPIGSSASTRSATASATSHRPRRLSLAGCRRGPRRRPGRRGCRSSGRLGILAWWRAGRGVGRGIPRQGQRSHPPRRLAQPAGAGHARRRGCAGDVRRRHEPDLGPLLLLGRGPSIRRRVQRHPGPRGDGNRREPIPASTSTSGPSMRRRSSSRAAAVGQREADLAATPLGVEVRVLPDLDHLEAFSRLDLVMPLVLGFLDQHGV